MSNESQDIERLIADAIEDAKDDSLDDKRLAEIRELLASSPAARNAYLKHNQLSSMLGSDERTADISEAAIAAVDVVPSLQTASPRGVRPAIAYAGWATAATVAVAFFLNAFWLSGEGGKVADDRGESAPVIAAAVITDQIDTQWPSSEAYAIGESVDRQWLRLRSGVVQLEFASGAQLALQGPAELRVDSDMECFLKSGKLTVLAPPEASRFTVKSPTGNVIDLGTEFGVVVDPSGQMDVHVLDGEVEVEVGDDQRRKLIENQAATIDPKKKRIEDAVIDRESFDHIRHATLAANKPLKLQFDCGIRAGVYQGMESPAHATGDVMSTEVYWNGLIGDQSGRFVLADGSVSQMALEVDYGQTQFVSESKRTFSWDAEPQLVRSAHCFTRGVFDTALGKDRLSCGGTVGLRIRGLPVGRYRVYFIARAVDDHKRGNYLVLKAFRVAVGADLSEIPQDAPVIAPLDDPYASRWVAGQTHHVGEVELAADAEYLTLLVRRDPVLSPQKGGGGTPIVGVQIVQINESEANEFEKL